MLLTFYTTSLSLKATASQLFMLLQTSSCFSNKEQNLDAASLYNLSGVYLTFRFRIL